MKTLALAAALLLSAAPRQAPPKPAALELWPGKIPGETGDPLEEKFTPGEKGPKRVDSVGKPKVEVYRPSKEKDTGAAIVVAPGGGYRMLAFEHEGTMVADWLTSIGVTCVLLTYRVPQRPGDGENKCPLMDAQRAIRLTRANAAAWGIDPARVGIMGFSAGGHLAANAAANPDRPAYEPQDDADKQSCRPDFAVLIYPGGVLDRQDKEKLSPQMRITKETPPSFLAVATDDKGSAAGTIKLFRALRDAGVSAELHVYAAGGHGFGMRKGELPCATWPLRCEEWMRNRGFLKK